MSDDKRGGYDILEDDMGPDPDPIAWVKRYDADMRALDAAAELDRQAAAREAARKKEDPFNCYFCRFKQNSCGFSWEKGCPLTNCDSCRHAFWAWKRNETCEYKDKECTPPYYKKWRR